MRLALAVLAVSVVLPAQPRSRKAHEHGSAKVNIAFEAARGVLEFEAPAQSVVGFEYAAKSAADRLKVATALQTLRARMGEMVIFPAGCTVTAKRATVEGGGEHSEVAAAFDVQCAKPLGGSEIRFGFAKVFPGIRAVDVALLADERQMSMAVENDKGVLKITK